MALSVLQTAPTGFPLPAQGYRDLFEPRREEYSKATPKGRLRAGVLENSDGVSTEATGILPKNETKKSWQALPPDTFRREFMQAERVMSFVPPTDFLEKAGQRGFDPTIPIDELKEALLKAEPKTKPAFETRAVQSTREALQTGTLRQWQDTAAIVVSADKLPDPGKDEALANGIANARAALLRFAEQQRNVPRTSEQAATYLLH